MLTQKVLVLCPGCGARLPWNAETHDTTANHLADCGVMPQPATKKLLRDVSLARYRGNHITWSNCDPSTTCRREQLISRFWPEKVVDPWARWDALDGVIWHEALADAAYGERVIPSLDDVGREAFPCAVRACLDGVVEAEVFPGIWYSTRIDHDDHRIMYDLKTKRYSKKEYPEPSEWNLQLVLSLRLKRLLYNEIPEKVGIWRLFKGSYEQDRTWRWFDKTALITGYERFERAAEETIRKHVEGLTGLFDQAEKLDQLELAELIRSLPLDGSAMFGGQKCSKYCSFKDTCLTNIQGIQLF